GHEIHPAGLAAEQLAGDALLIHDVLQILRDARFVAGRIGGVEADEIDQVLPGPRAYRSRVLSGGHTGRERKREQPDPPGSMVADLDGPLHDLLGRRVPPELLALPV